MGGRVEELAGRADQPLRLSKRQAATGLRVRSAALVRELGFDAAVSTSKGAARVGSDPFQVPRFTPWDIRPFRFAAQIASNLTTVQPAYASA